MSVTEAELKEAAVTPRVTLEQVEATIDTEQYFFPQAAPTLTVCVLVLKNGFSVTGEAACADPANFKTEIGMKLARANAVNKIWPLLGYELKSKLHNQVPCNGWKDRLREEMLELKGRLTKLEAYVLTASYRALPWTERQDLSQQLDAMRAYHMVLSRRAYRNGAMG